MSHRKPHDHHPRDDGASDSIAAPPLSKADPNATHPPDDIPVNDAKAFLAFLRAGVFTPDQLRYLFDALPVYQASSATQGDPVALSIVDAWQRVLVGNVEPPKKTFG